MTEPKKVRVKSTTAKKLAEATEQVADFLEITDLGAYMRGEIAPPDMLLPKWLQRNVLHWAQGEPEDGKSWVMLWCAVQLLELDDEARVLIMDGEMGSRAVAERLRVLGLDPGAAEARVTHVNLSSVGREHFAKFVVWAVAMRFDLIIWDPIAHHLAGAAMNEDSNSDVAEWIARVVNPLLAKGSTVIGVDHIVKNGDSNGYARGASAKKARARVVYEFDKKVPFDRETIGHIIVRVEKNSDASDIPRLREIYLGGDPNSGRFVFRVSDREPVVKTDRRRDTARSVVDKAVAILEALPEGQTELSQGALYQQIGGKKATTLAALREAATVGLGTHGGRLSQRVEDQGKRTFTYYSLRREDDVRQA
jgi:AAA domain-containing protein